MLPHISWLDYPFHAYSYPRMAGIMKPLQINYPHCMSTSSLFVLQLFLFLHRLKIIKLKLKAIDIWKLFWELNNLIPVQSLLSPRFHGHFSRWLRPISWTPSRLHILITPYIVHAYLFVIENQCLQIIKLNNCTKKGENPNFDSKSSRLAVERPIYREQNQIFRLFGLILRR